MNTETGLLLQVWNELSKYVSSLDWSYILTFIIIAYGINSTRMREQLRKRTKLTFKSKYRVTITGALYAVALYFIRGYDISMIEPLFSSFVFAIVFQGLIIEGIKSFIKGKLGKKDSNCNRSPYHLNGHENE